MTNDAEPFGVKGASSKTEAVVKSMNIDPDGPRFDIDRYTADRYSV